MSTSNTYGSSDGTITLLGEIRTPDTGLVNQRRSILLTESLARYNLPPHLWRKFDSYGELLPSTGASDDLGATGGTHGTNVPTIQSGDMDSLGATNRRARLMFWLPPEYQATEQVRLSFWAGMLQNVADNSATLDAQVFKADDDNTITGIDLVNTAVQDINSLLFQEIQFVLSPSTLNPGDLLDIMITVAVNDASTGAPVIACLAKAALLMNIKG